MKTLLVSMILVYGLSFSLEAKTWTNREGKSLEAEFLSVNGPKGAETVRLKLQEGREAAVPLASLSDEDQKYVKEEAANQSLAKNSVIGQAVEGKLVSLQGEKVRKLEVASTPKHYALYFSASWCPPCREFTPKLVQFYKQSAKAGKEFEVVLISSDNSEGDMEKYLKEFEISFPALQYRYADRLKEIVKHKGNGIPCLVLLDHEGKVLSHSYVNGQYVGPSIVLRELEKL